MATNSNRPGDVEWEKLREMVLHRDGKCMVCGGVIGLTPHHIKSRGAGGLDSEENLITLCPFCHDCAHHGYVVPGRRMLRSKALRLRIYIVQGRRMREYFRDMLAEKYGYLYGEGV